jgi:hypothetical protein
MAPGLSRKAAVDIDTFGVERLESSALHAGPKVRIRLREALHGARYAPTSPRRYLGAARLDGPMPTRDRVRARRSANAPC